MNVGNSMQIERAFGLNIEFPQPLGFVPVFDVQHPIFDFRGDARENIFAIVDQNLLRLIGVLCDKNLYVVIDIQTMKMTQTARFRSNLSKRLPRLGAVMTSTVENEKKQG